jgi:hypothetical protein
LFIAGLLGEKNEASSDFDPRHKDHSCRLIGFAIDSYLGIFLDFPGMPSIDINAERVFFSSDQAGEWPRGSVLARDKKSG